MSLTPEIIDAMLESGCTAEQLAAVMKADIEIREKAKKERRIKDLERKRKQRESVEFHDVTRNPADSADKKEKRKKEPKKEKIKNILPPYIPPSPVLEVPKRATVPKPPDVSHETFQDFIRQRKTKFTNTALRGIRREAEKAGCTLEDALVTAIERGWQSFKADWVREKHGKSTSGNRKYTAQDALSEVLAEIDAECGESEADQPHGGAAFCGSGHLRQDTGAVENTDENYDRGFVAIPDGGRSSSIPGMAAGADENPDTG